MRRSHRLVVSFIAIVSNYEYGFYGCFYQDGTIQYESKLTSVLSTAAVMPGEMPKYRTRVAPQINTPIHQHIFKSAWICRLMAGATYMTKHLWVTPYRAEENYPAGDYPNRHPGGVELSQWTEGDRQVEDTNIVVWYTFAHSHLLRTEDWPVMPIATIGFMLKPINFFDENPANDVPPSPAKHSCCILGL